MKKLKIWFSDMWGYENYQFDTKNNYFSSLLSLRYKVKLDSTNPDLLIYSCFGEKHKTFDCKKIFFTGENSVPPGVTRQIYPCYEDCDYSLSFFPDSSKNKYFPLWVIFINWFGEDNPKALPSNPTYLVEPEFLIASKERNKQLQN